VHDNEAEVVEVDLSRIWKKELQSEFKAKECMFNVVLRALKIDSRLRILNLWKVI